MDSSKKNEENYEYVCPNSWGNLLEYYARMTNLKIDLDFERKIIQSVTKEEEKVEKTELEKDYKLLDSIIE